MVSRYQADTRHPADLGAAAGPRRSSIGQPSVVHIEVPGVSRPARKPGEKLSDERLGKPSAEIRGRAEAAGERQRGRFAGISLMSNAAALACARVGPGEVRDYCQVDDACG
jgi:hypothetical protein